jgi:hypothetical protein
MSYITCFRSVLPLLLAIVECSQLIACLFGACHALEQRTDASIVFAPEVVGNCEASDVSPCICKTVSCRIFKRNEASPTYMIGPQSARRPPVSTSWSATAVSVGGSEEVNERNSYNVKLVCSKRAVDVDVNGSMMPP